MLRRPEPRAVDRDSDEGARFKLAPHFETRATARLQTPCARALVRVSRRPRACSSLTTVPDSREPPTVDRLERPPADANVPSRPPTRPPTLYVARTSERLPRRV